MSGTMCAPETISRPEAEPDGPGPTWGTDDAPPSSAANDGVGEAIAGSAAMIASVRLTRLTPPGSRVSRDA
jgi:hypothetical protein